MNRLILVAMVGLALAGCAQTRPPVPLSRNGSRLPPVGLTPVPNIYEAINRENERLDPRALHPGRGPVLANVGTGSGPGMAANSAPGRVPVGSSSSPSRISGETPVPSTAPGPDPGTPGLSPTTSVASGRAEPAPISSFAAPSEPAGAEAPGAGPESGPATLTEPPVPASEPAAPQELLPPALPSGEPTSPVPDLVPGPTPDLNSGPQAGQDRLDLPPPGPLPTLDLPPTLAAENPPLPATSATLEPAEVPQTPAPTAPTPNLDPAVVTVNGDLTAIHAEGTPVTLKEAGKVAAYVGDEVITVHELTNAVKEKVANLPNGYKPNQREILGISSQILDMLIERSTIIQEARREMKDPKRLNMFMDIAVKQWRENEIPPMLRKMAVTNEYELKQKLAEQGQSLDAMREAYKLDFLAKGYLESKLRPRITVDVPEMRAYYNAHLDDFNRPARWTWREVIVEFEKHTSRAEARKKAEAILARLRSGEDFTKVAQAESEGPNRATGGLWETSPDSYSVAAVNDALKALPIGQVSPIIEGESSYHVVRVEDRRDAGPAPFPEVQDKVRTIVHRQKAQQESDAYLDKIRERTVVTTIFDRTDYAPRATRVTPANTP